MHGLAHNCQPRGSRQGNPWKKVNSCSDLKQNDTRYILVELYNLWYIREMNPPPQPRVPSMNFDWEIRNTIEKIQLLSRWDILLTKPRETRGRYPQHSCDYVSVSIFSFATDSCGARTPTSPYDFEANFPALVVLGFNLFHSLRQLSIWNVRNKEWSIEAPSCEPVLLLKFLLFLPLIFIPCSPLVDWPPAFSFCNPSLGIFSVWQI